MRFSLAAFILVGTILVLNETTTCAQQYRLSLKWDLPLRATYVTPTGVPSIAGNIALFASDQVVAVDRTKGLILWEAAPAKLMPRGLLVSGDRFFEAEDHVRALLVANGTSLWDRELNQGAEFAIPEIVGHKLFVGTDQGKVLIFNSLNGDLKRELLCERTAAFRSIVTGIKAIGSTLYVSMAVWDDARGLSSHGTLIAIDANKEQVIWRFRSDHDRTRAGFTSQIQPVSDDLLVSDGLANRIYRIGSNGQKIWVAEGVPRSFGVADPLIQKGNLIYMGSADGNVYAIDSSTGHTVWRRNLRESIFSMSSCGSQIVALGQQMYILSSSGEVEWGPREPVRGERLSSVAASDGDGDVIIAGPSTLYELFCSEIKELD